MHFSWRIFLAKFQNLGLKLYTQRETITGLLKNDKLGSKPLFLKQNLANSIILPPKNGGLKAWSHGVRKANCVEYEYLNNSPPSPQESSWLRPWSYKQPRLCLHS